MSPDSLESRMAALKQHVDDLSNDVIALVGLSTQHAVLAEQITTIRENLNTIRRDLDGLHEGFRKFREQIAQREQAFKDSLDKREQLQAKERKLDRRWMIGTVLASTSVIVGALAIVASVIS